MAFKMKGPSLHKGTAGHAKATVDYAQMRLNRTMDNTSVADGRAGSSAAQYNAAPTKAATGEVKWGKEKEVKKTVTDNEMGGKNTRTDYETKGTSYKKPTKTPEGDKKYAAMSKDERKAADDKYTKAHTKTHTKGRSKSSQSRKEREKIAPIPPKKVGVPIMSDGKPYKAKETRRQKYDRKKKERKDKLPYTVSSEKKTFKRKVIKDKETGKERKVGRSKFGKLVSKVTGRDTVKKSRKPKKKRCRKVKGSTICSALGVSGPKGGGQSMN